MEWTRWTQELPSAKLEVRVTGTALKEEVARSLMALAMDILIEVRKPPVDLELMRDRWHQD